MTATDPGNWDDAERDAGDVRDDEGPGEHDAHLMDDGEPIVACPECGKLVWEEAERCPRCGYYFAAQAADESPEAKARRGRMAITAVVLIVVIVVVWVLFRL